jgi:ParB-like chromosome segregation protein Spo0J
MAGRRFLKDGKVVDFEIELDKLEAPGATSRARVETALVGSFADLMTMGVKLPPLEVYFDGTTFWLADGFHRVAAARKLNRTTMPAMVMPGDKMRALLALLAANKASRSDDDKRHVAHLALTDPLLKTWNNQQLSEHIGVGQDLIQRVRRSVGFAEAAAPQRQKIAELLKEGKSSSEVKAITHAHGTTIAEVRRELGIGTKSTARAAVRERREQLRAMAEEGYSIKQIAAKLGCTTEWVANTSKAMDIDLGKSRTTAKLPKHDANRIMDHMAMDAENLAKDVELIAFHNLRPERFDGWLKSLQAGKKDLDALIRRLKEHKAHVESSSISSTGTDAGE